MSLVGDGPGGVDARRGDRRSSVEVEGDLRGKKEKEQDDTEAGDRRNQTLPRFASRRPDTTATIRAWWPFHQSRIL
ncbi:MAG: hypothetical protein NVSMB16_01670 [Acidimicrobiales bacterium]